MPLPYDPSQNPQQPYNPPYKINESVRQAVNLWWENLSYSQHTFIEKWAKDRAMWTFPHSDWIVRMYYVSWEYMLDYPE